MATTRIGRERFDMVSQGYFPDDATCYDNNKGCTPNDVQFTHSKVHERQGWFACNNCAHITNEDTQYIRTPRKPHVLNISGE